MALDPCVAEEKKFNTLADALRGQAAATAAKFANWNDNPDTIPEDVLAEYRSAVKDYAFGVWKDSPTGKGVVQSWQPIAEDAAKAKFLEFIYAKEIPPELEKKLAQSVFQKDYADHLKSKLGKMATEVNDDINANKEKLDGACSAGEFSKFLRMTLGNAMIMVHGNFDAAKREDGEIAKAVRATTGISVTDILKDGLQGGPNSEVAKFNKMLEDVLDKNGMGGSTVVGQVFNSINPTKWSVDLPNVHLPNVHLPDVHLPDIHLPDIPLPKPKIF